MAYIGQAPLPNYDFEDQGVFGTCEGNGLAHQLEYEALKSFPGQQLMFSRLFIYRQSKILEGNWNEGTNPLFGYQALIKWGVPLESDYPYSILTDIHNIPEPSQTAYANALKYRIKGFTQLATTTDVIDQALNAGKVVNVGTLVTDNFVNEPENGFVGLPSGSILGGHDYVIIGHDDTMTHTFPNGQTQKGFYLIQNSWKREQKMWVSKAFIAFHLDYGQPILSCAYIVDTGWLVPQPTPTPVPQPIPEPTTKKLYHVQVGAFSTEANAKVMLDKLQTAGFKGYIKYE